MVKVNNHRQNSDLYSDATPWNDEVTEPSVRIVQGAYTYLEQTLAAGPRALRRQVQAIVACWRESGARNVTTLPVMPSVSKLSPLVTMAPHLGRGQLMQLVQSIVETTEAHERAPLLVEVAAHVPAQQSRQLMRYAWESLQDISHPYPRTLTLIGLASLVQRVAATSKRENGVARILSVAQQMRNPDAFIRSLVVLAPHLPIETSINVQRSVLSSLKRLKNDVFSSQFLVALAPNLPKQLEAQAMELAFKIKTPSDRLWALVALAQHLPGRYRESLLRMAVETVEGVDSEQLRAQMLIDFVPGLVLAQSQPGLYHALVEKVSTMAVLITRRVLRAQALVALSAHLGPDLQGAALSDLHTLDDERECAALLKELARSLPGNLVVASLAIAYTMRDESARAEALCALAHFVPESARKQTIQDALAAAHALPNYFERVKAYISLLDVLDAEQRENVLAKALEVAQAISNERTQARALIMLSSYLPSHLLSQAADVLAELSEPDIQVNALIGLYAALDEEERELAAHEMLLCAQRISAHYKRAQALMQIAPHLPTSLTREVLVLARDLDDPADRTNVLLVIASALPNELRMPFVRKAQADYEDIGLGYDRAAALSTLIPLLPPDEKGRYQEAIIDAIASVPDDYDRASAIALLAPVMAGEFGHLEEHSSTIPPGSQLLQDGLVAALQIPDAVLRQHWLRRGLEIGQQENLIEDPFSLWSFLALRIASLPQDAGMQCLSELSKLVSMFQREQGASIIAIELAQIEGFV